MKKKFYIVSVIGMTWGAWMMASCDKDKQLPIREPEELLTLAPVDEDDENIDDNPGQPKDYVHTVAFLTATELDMGGSGINLASGEVFKGANAHNYIHAIDLLYLDFSNATAGNIALPESRELSVNAYGEDIQYGWRHKNQGILFRLDDVQPKDITWFNDAKSASRINTVVDSMISVLSVNTEDHKLRHRNVKGGDIFIFKSITKNISSIIYVDQQITVENGSQCRLIIKTDTTQLQEISPVQGGLLNANENYYADVITATFNPAQKTEIFFDFMKKEAYTRAQLAQLDDFSGINLLFTYNPTPPNNNPLHNIYTPTSTWMYGSSSPNYNSHYGSRELYDYLNAPGTNISTMWFWQLDERTSPLYADYTFEQVRLNNAALLAYYEHWGNLSSWGSNQINPPNNRVYRIRNTTDGAYGAFKILNIDKIAGEISIAVKYYNSLD